jgi:methylmalonyl-CoA/ethylmalonyl-CoA epimerase
MLKIEHIGIAVKDLKASNKLFTRLLGTEPYKEEVIESENVKTSFFKAGDTKIELIESMGGQNAISKFIEKKGEGMHHIAYAVDDIFSEIKRLKSEGFIFVNEEPKKGADNKLICFLHPGSTNGVLIELCQDLK